MEGLRKDKYKDGSEKEDQRYNKTDIIEKVDAGPKAEILKVYAPSVIGPCSDEPTMYLLRCNILNLIW